VTSRGAATPPRSSAPTAVATFWTASASGVPSKRAVSRSRS
jgi:hypothetical protein